MKYPEAILYLESFINYEKIPAYPYKESLRLERLKDFLKIIDNPQDSLKAIHIAGTKGKGSTCAFIAYILRQRGYKVGLYTSPHLSDFRERIRILAPNTEHPKPNSEFEGMVSEDELAGLVIRLKPVIEKYNTTSEYGPLSFFEVYTALAFVYFKEEKVDFVVLETGLGGRLDATNVVDPLVCAITPISYEHTQKLGNTLKEIAAEKAGIIKIHKVSAQASPKGTKSVRKPPRRGQRHQLIVVSAPQEKEAIQEIRNRCKQVNAKLYEVGKDIFYERTTKGFNVLGMFAEYPNLETRLLGDHQLINASVGVGVIEALRLYDVFVDTDSIRQGLLYTVWPGRCEIIAENPFIIIDGAQNIASARALKKTIKENFSASAQGRCASGANGGKYKKLILVLGISNDKDIKGICNELNSLADEIILTKADNPRATEPKIIAQYFKGKKLRMTNSIKEAKEEIACLAKKEDLILVTGSLFVAGEFRDDKI
jgi:dihydrofolate synthase/folylpolyglutamate synthase